MIKHTLSGSVSIHLNRRMGGKFSHLTVCAEAWILHRTGRVFLLDLLMFVLFRERHHCQNQYLTYGAKKGFHHETHANTGRRIRRTD